MKNSKLFQYIVTGAFIFFIILGGILFSTYRSADKNSVNINITIWGTLPNDAFTAFMSRYFNESSLKYTVNYEEIETNSFDQVLVEALASGVGPDAIILPEDLIVRFSNRVYTIPFTVLPELQFKQTFIQEGELYLNGQGVMALPLSIDPLVMYWNRDIFNTVSVTKPPVNWSEISNLVSRMTKKDPAQNIIRSTTALGEFRNITNAKEILAALIMQAGNPIITLNLEEGSLDSTLAEDFDLTTAPAIAALEFFTNFSNPTKREYSWNRSLANSQDAFANGDLAIYFGFASEFTRIKNKNPNLNFDVAALPQIQGARTFSTFGNMLGLAIMKNSTDPGGTYSVITALTSANAFPFWNDIFNLPSARRDILGQVDKSAIRTVFNQSAIMSRSWLDPDQARTSNIFQEMVESYTTGRESIEGAVNTASDRLESLLGN